MQLPEYKEYYKNTKRIHYLDNSAYEYQFIDGGFNIDYFYETIKEISPTHVIIPDVIGDKDATISSFEHFDFHRLSVDTKIIGVIQGKTYKELHDCYDFLVQHCDIVAIVFHSDAYQKKFSNEDKAKADALGRVQFIRELIKRKAVLPNSLHLIGMSLPSELTCYTEDELKYIYSIDTANPFQYAATKGLYPNIEDIKNKPSYILTDDIISQPVSSEVYDIFKLNAQTFKNLIKR
jgi:hypothetical protein